MEPRDQIEHTKSYNDAITRRLKNRDRQRRYRERKRLEAHSKKASSINSSTQLQVEKQLNGNLTNGTTTRVHCKRNWKKDARMAHKLKGQAVVISHGPDISASTLANESGAPHLPVGMTAEPLLESKLPSSSDNHETTSTRHGRRDWKADARKKYS